MTSYSTIGFVSELPRDVQHLLEQMEIGMDQLYLEGPPSSLLPFPLEVQPAMNEYLRHLILSYSFGQLRTYQQSTPPA